MKKYENQRKIKAKRKLTKECERDQRFYTSILWE